MTSPLPQNPAISYMEESREKMAIFAALLQAAQTVFAQSKQAFEIANEISTTNRCPTRQQLQAELQERYSALSQLLKAIDRTLKEPMLQRMLAVSSNQTLRYPTLQACLPAIEQRILCAGIASLLGYNHSNCLHQEDGQVAEVLFELVCRDSLGQKHPE